MIDSKKLGKIKLIIFDLDGTLLDDEGNIGKETVRLVSRLKDAGVMFSFATGRLECAIADYAAELKITTPLISLDGALIQSFPDKVTLFESYVPEKYVRRVVELAEENLLKVALCHDDAIYYHEYNPTIPFILDKFGARFKEVDSYDGCLSRTLEIVVAGEHKQAIKNIRKKISFPYGFGLEHSFYNSHSNKDIYYLDVRKNGVSKGTGLKRLVEHYKINIKETAVLGDWHNDISLFETGALKIAVGNAIPEIKEKAHYVTTRTNNDDAVAEFLEMVLRAKEG